MRKWRRLLFLTIAVLLLIGLPACKRKQGAAEPTAQIPPVEAVEENYDLTLYDPADRWLPFTLADAEPAQGWLARYGDALSIAQQVASPTDAAATNVQIPADSEDTAVPEDLPEGFPINDVPIYRFLDISQSGYDEEFDSLYFHYDCDAPYKDAVAFYQNKFSGQPGFSIEEDGDSTYIDCMVSGRLVQVVISDYYGNDTAYVEIDVQRGA